MYNKYLIKEILPILNIENSKVTKKINFSSKKNNTVDPVTKFDVNIEKKIKNKILKDFPKHSFSGEELEDTFSNESEITWIVDPIDGTKALLCGQPTWSNLIGVKKRDEMVSSFINFHELKKIYYTNKNKSYILESNLKPKVIMSSKIKNLSQAKLITNSIHTFYNNRIFNFFNNYKNFFKITGCDAYNFCMIAEGKIDVMIEAGLKQVDILPVKKLLENAGAIITNWEGHRDISEGKIIASGNKLLHNQFLKLIKLNKI